MRAAVIPCSARKLERPARVEELYTGPLFRSALLAAQALKRDGLVDRVLVLSALHGLVTLDTLLAPYDLKLERGLGITAPELARHLVELHADMNPEEHEFTEDVDDGSMCICGVPALSHDVVYPPGQDMQLVELLPLLPRAYDTRLREAAELLWPPLVDVLDNPLHGSRGLLEQRGRLRLIREDVTA